MQRLDDIARIEVSASIYQTQFDNNGKVRHNLNPAIAVLKLKSDNFCFQNYLGDFTIVNKTCSTHAYSEILNVSKAFTTNKTCDSSEFDINYTLFLNHAIIFTFLVLIKSLLALG